MKIRQNYDLSRYNTFGITAYTKFFTEISKEKELENLFTLPEFRNEKKLFLGGGSNVLFTKDFEGMVVQNNLRGIEVLREDQATVTIHAMGGVIWHDLVKFTVKEAYWGLENLSLIPGTVGAAPMQNIGAYGAELKEVLESVEAYEISNGQKKVFSPEECELGYRDSVFKGRLKGKYFISAISVKLSKIPKPNTSYKALREFLEKNNITVRIPKDVSDAVVAIRESKLPDPKYIGNAGSFFKNIFVTEEKLKELQEKWPEMPYFSEEEQIKIPAAWLIEQCGPSLGTSWKGYRRGNIGVHEKQSLVLVNYGGGTGQELLALAEDIILSVKEKFNLTLTPEVNII
jgi:UDP-N-acetylmuramate dehydrogenase